jgi:hypothetical protein
VSGISTCDPDHPGQWINNVSGAPVVPYRVPDVLEALANDHTIFIVEGEAKVDLLWTWNLAATCNPGGSKKWNPEHSEYLRSADVVVLPDNDGAGREHVSVVGAALAGIAKRLRVLELPGLPPKGDIIDWAKAGGTREQLDVLLETAPAWDEHAAPAKTGRLCPHNLKDFLQLKIRPRQKLLGDIVPEKGLVMVYAVRGTGKTLVALGFGYAVATGTEFLKWQAPTPRRVLLIDGEMPAAVLQERLSWIVRGNEGRDPGDNLKILVGDLIEEGGIGNLASEKVQAELEPHLNGIDLLILDNCRPSPQWSATTTRKAGGQFKNICYGCGGEISRL